MSSFTYEVKHQVEHRDVAEFNIRARIHRQSKQGPVSLAMSSQLGRALVNSERGEQ